MLASLGGLSYTFALGNFASTLAAACQIEWGCSEDEAFLLSMGVAVVGAGFAGGLNGPAGGTDAALIFDISSLGFSITDALFAATVAAVSIVATKEVAEALPEDIDPALRQAIASIIVSTAITVGIIAAGQIMAEMQDSNAKEGKGTPPVETPDKNADEQSSGGKKSKPKEINTTKKNTSPTDAGDANTPVADVQGADANPNTVDSAKVVPINEGSSAHKGATIETATVGDHTPTADATGVDMKPNDTVSSEVVSAEAGSSGERSDPGCNEFGENNAICRGHKIR